MFTGEIEPQSRLSSFNDAYMTAILIQAIDHFTVVCLVAWPLNESETGVDLVLIETSLIFLC